MKKCVHCDEVLEDDCFYGDKRKNNKLSPYCIQCESKRKKKQLISFKKQCLEYKNQYCCTKCGYDKNITALDFHHREKSEKDFTISSSKKLQITQEIKDELDKCDVVCSNCHREIHSNLSYDFNPKILKPRENPICLDCGKECTYGASRCLDCQKTERRLNIPKIEQITEDIKNLIYLEAIGRKYSVTGNCVRKWIKSYGLYDYYKKNKSK